MSEVGKYQIRKVDPDEHDDIIIVLQRLCLPTDKLLEIDGYDWWFVFDSQNEPVGFGAMRNSYRFSDCGYLARAGVLKPWRGRGLQARLIKARMRYAKAMRWEWVFTDTMVWNYASSNSLISCGFKLFRPLRPWGCKQSLYWRRRVVQL